MITILMPLFANSNICVRFRFGSAVDLFLIMRCIISITCLSSTLTSLGSECFCTPVNVFEFCSGTQLF